MSRDVRIPVSLLGLIVAVWLAVPPLHAAMAPPPPQFMTNLLANPNADAGNLSGWQILENGGAGWIVQHGEFRTSYVWDRRQQVIDLWSRGFDADLMAKAPPIVISEDFVRQYCPDRFYLKVELLDSNLQVVASWNSGERVNSGACQWGGEVWDRLTHTFRDYAPGVRYVRWEDGGKSSEFWGGHYGARLDNAELVVLDDRHPAYWHNLLVNPEGVVGTLAGWQILESGGAGWTANAAGPDGGTAFQTSSGWSRRQQEVDLRQHGFAVDTMARSPLIRASQSFQGEGCPDEYYLKVELLDAERKVVAGFDTGVRTTSGTCTAAGGWDDQFHSFADYGPGVRYIRWEDGGRDTAGQSGHHGTRMAEANLRIYTDNLLANPGTETGDFSGWQITENGGAGWIVETSVRDGHLTRSSATSWSWDRRVQTVDLMAKGYTAALLDQAPPIHVQEQFRRVFCPDEYYLKVDLLDAQGGVVTSWSSGIVANGGDCRWGEEVWEEVYHIFHDYGPGVRFVRWEDGGKDREFWGGHYGPQLDAAYLTVQDHTEYARHHPHFRALSSRPVCGGQWGIPCCGEEDGLPCPAPESCQHCQYETFWDQLRGHKTCYTEANCYESCNLGLWVVNGRCQQKPSIGCCNEVTMAGVGSGQGYSAWVDLRLATSVVPGAVSSCPNPTVSALHPVGSNPSGGGPWSEVYPWVNLFFNANFFDITPPRDPYSDSCSRPLGLTVSQGQIVSPAGNALSEPTETLVIFTPLGRTGTYADIVPQPLTSPGIGRIQNAVSGFRLLRDGVYVEQPVLIGAQSLRPRTVVGLDSEKRKLVVVVVNTGQDTGAGASLPALADYLIHLGVVDALTLDGSGSAQLFYRDRNVITLPSDNRPNQTTRFFRPIPVFLGFY
jgi:hypothetical protein